VILSVKPQTMRELVEEIVPGVTRNHLLISVAASVPTSFIEGIVNGEVPVVRAMPNTPCIIRAGMTALCAGRHASEQHLQLAKSLFDAVGRTLVLDEKHMDAVTGLSASGPAFIYIIIESLAEAGVKVGLARDVATELAAQTTLGASKMVLATSEHPAKLKDAVTTPAGCTIDGILELEEGGLRVTLIKAVVKATERAKALLYS
jgi:pyrroline-5-carboxylate reductase